MLDRNHSTFVFLGLAAVVVGGMLANVASAQEPDPRELLDRMGAEVAGLDSFIINGYAYADARLPAGQIIENASHVTMRVRKPDSMHMTKRDTESTKELYVGGGLLTMFTAPVNLYAQTEVPEGVGVAVDFAIMEVGIDAPLLDFVSQDIADNMLEDAEQVDYLGTSLIQGVIHDHIAIRSADVDVQIWIASEGRPLPGKMSVISKWEGGSPRFIVFMEWNTNPSFPDESFSFVAPQGATKINFVSAP
jgi:hypothetical protein